MHKLVGVVASYEMALNELVLEGWRDLFANVSCIRAARMEPASLRRINGTRHFAWQDYSCGLVLDIRDWNSGNQAQDHTNNPARRSA